MDLVTLRLSVTHDYLFRNGTQWVLVDTGYAEDAGRFREELHRAGIRVRDISHIILTHHHDDHVGLVPSLVRAHPGVSVVLSAATRDLLLAGRNDRSHPVFILNRRVAFLLRFKRVLLGWRTGSRFQKKNDGRFEPYAVRAGDRVFTGEPHLRDLGIAAEGRILSVPGHTVDSHAVLFRDGDCLAGDAAASFFTLAGTHHCVVGLSDLDGYYRSWEKLLAAGAHRILPAHGLPFPAFRLRADLGRNRAEDLIPVRR
jgi:glyoxylase-like metal-dependent hydrolase (beta-lactamase superfamily II)